MNGQPPPSGRVVAMVVIAFLVRLAALPSLGFSTDVSTFVAWAERLAATGPGSFYEPGYFADYPPGFLYVLWLLGVVFDGDILRFAVKAISIPFDFGIALLAGSIAMRWAGAAARRWAAALWLLAPTAIIAGPLWGQVDAVGTFVLLAALDAAGRGRWIRAGLLAGLAAMIKPQLGVGILVLTVAAIHGLLRGDRGPTKSLVAGGMVALTLGLPFHMGPLELIGLVRDAAATYPYSSLHAFNIWSVIVGFWVPDDSYVVIGGMLLALGLVGACVVVVRRHEDDRFLVAGALATMAFYFLATRAHERYIFPALVLLLPVVASRVRSLLIPYLVVSFSVAATLLYALSRYAENEPTMPAWLETSLFSRPGQIVLAVVLMASAAVLALRLVRGTVEPVETVVKGSAIREVRVPRALPAGLRPGHAPERRDLIIAVLVAVAMLLSRGYRLDFPRDMYFDEVYHARTAFELLAERDPYEWTHPHLAKEIMALFIPVFGDDRVTAREVAPASMTAFATANDGTRVYGLADGTIELRGRGGGEVRDIAHVTGTPRAVALEGLHVLGATDALVFDIDVMSGALVTRPYAGPLTSFGTISAAPIVATATEILFFATPESEPVSVPGGAVALTVKPDGTEVYALDATGDVRVIDTQKKEVTRTVTGNGPGTAIAYAQSTNRLFIARSDEPALGMIELEGGNRETVPLGNARTGSFAKGATALAIVPRTQFLYALADGRVVVVETHGVSPYAQIPAGSGGALGIDGTGDALLVVGDQAVSSIETGRHAFAWRLPGVIAGAALAFFLVLLSRRLFASRVLPALVGAVVLLDGSMFAQPRIAMNDVYTALFIVAGWYFVVAAHAPRKSRRLDLLVAGLCFGLALAAKWAGAYAIGGVFIASLVVTWRAHAANSWRGVLESVRASSYGPLDLLGGRGRNAAFLFLCFALIPAEVYLGSYLSWFGGRVAPYGWDLAELTRQMFQYHSSLTAPHPAGSPWWSWPVVLKPVYWYYGQSEAGRNAYIYDAGNLALFWAALGATVWCAVTAIRRSSLRLGFVVFALLVQYVAWIPITRVLFFYHFFTALPFYLLALATLLAVWWEERKQRRVNGLLGLALAVAIFFYPFVSALPVDATSASMYFVLPTWQYDCQFYPSDGTRFQCNLTGGSLDVVDLVGRLALAGGIATLVVVGALAFVRSRGGKSS